MRLIDADAVSAEIEKLLYPAPNRDSMLYNCGVNDALNVIEDAETVDAVPVIRCKNCRFATKRRDDVESSRHQCVVMNMNVSADEYCYVGERRPSPGIKKRWTQEDLGNLSEYLAIAVQNATESFSKCMEEVKRVLEEDK